MEKLPRYAQLTTVEYEKVVERFSQLQAENKRLKKALKRYGRHQQCDCQSILVESKGKGKGWYPKKCSCGFEQALKGD